MALALTAAARGAGAQGRIGALLHQASPYEHAIADGDTALGRGDLDTAERAFGEARRLDARDARAPFYLGEVAMRRERFGDAEARFGEALAISPDLTEAMVERGRALVEVGRTAEAVALLERAVAREPTLAPAFLALGSARLELGRAGPGIEALRTAVRLDPNEPHALLGLALALAAQPRATPPEPLDLLHRVVAHAQGDRDLLATAAPVMRRLGDAPGAVAAFARARTLGAPDASMLAEWAQALWASGDRDGAIVRADEAVALAPRAADVRYVRALLRLARGEQAAAVTDLQVVATDPRDPALATRARERLRALAAPPGPVAPVRRRH